jgi:oligopeptide/dipeptide ABC transporter ATP-binding protein
MNQSTDELLRVEDVRKYFPVVSGLFKKHIEYMKAVDGVSLTITKGMTFGLVGESGCGKTTLGRCILLLTPVTSGHIFFQGKDISSGSSTSRPAGLSSSMQVIFQDPASSLNPRHTMKFLITEPLVVQGKPRSEIDERFREMCGLVGIEPDMGGRYPHMFSGGQKQRISIARAMISKPAFVVCDEPVSSLDVSIRAQITNLLKDLQQKLGLTYLFISHDLAGVHYISDVVGVMYLGKIVEISPKAELYRHPLHPYTRALLSAVPIPDPAIERERKRILLQGEVSDSLNGSDICRFRPRCWMDGKNTCREEEPRLREVGAGHWVACHLT